MKKIVKRHRKVEDWDIQLLLKPRFEIMRGLKCLNVFPWLLKLGMRRRNAAVKINVSIEYEEYIMGT